MEQESKTTLADIMILLCDQYMQEVFNTLATISIERKKYEILQEEKRSAGNYADDDND